MSDRSGAKPPSDSARATAVAPDLDRRDLAKLLLGLGGAGAAAAAILEPTTAHADRGDREHGAPHPQPQWIEDFWCEDDGRLDDPELDWLPVIMRAQASRVIPPPPADPVGFTLLFRPRDYRFSGTIHLIRSMSLVGSGGSESYAGTRFLFPADVTAIIAHSFGTAAAAGYSGGGTWSFIERLQIIGELGTNPDAHAVVMHARIKLAEVAIRKFSGNGVQVQADVAQRPVTNANGWQLENVRISKCTHGVFLQGGDANTGCALAVDISACRGWGIWDSSFLGNTFVACQVAGCRAGGYRADGGNARSLFLNCYTEGDTPASFITPPSLVIGGFMLVHGGGGAIDMSGGGLRFPNGFTVPNTSDPNQPVFVQLGENTPGTVLTLTDPIHPWWPYRLRFAGQQPGWWELNWGLLDFQTPLRFSTRVADVGQGQLWMENGFFVGRHESRVHVSSAPSVPTEGTFRIGDQLLNSNPEPGGFVGWVYTASGWRGFGRIE